MVHSGLGGGVGVKHKVVQHCGGGRMVCMDKNIANCSKNPEFIPVICALCACCSRTRPWAYTWALNPERDVYG